MIQDKIERGDVFRSLRPGSTWTQKAHKDGSFELTWLDDSTVKPTEKEINTEMARLQAEYDALEYARNRKNEYDRLNQLELISDDTNNGTTTHIDAVNAIKAKYPKP
jgi:uncharacterized protein YcnI